MNKNDYINRVDSLKASEELKTRIALEAVQRSKRKTGIVKYAVAAACIVLVIIAGVPLFIATRGAKSADQAMPFEMFADSAENEAADVISEVYDYEAENGKVCQEETEAVVEGSGAIGDGAEYSFGFDGAYDGLLDGAVEATTFSVTAHSTNSAAWSALSQPVEVVTATTDSQPYSYSQMLGYYGIAQLPADVTGMTRESGEYAVDDASGDVNSFVFNSYEKQIIITVSKETKTNYIPDSCTVTEIPCADSVVGVQFACYGDKCYAEFVLGGNCCLVEFKGFSPAQAEENIRNALLAVCDNQ